MPNGDLIFQRTKVTDDWTRTESEWVYIKDNDAHKFKITFNLYSGVELRGLLEKAGFSEVKLYGDLKAGAYNQQAKRLVALARK